MIISVKFEIDLKMCTTVVKYLKQVGIHFGEQLSTYPTVEHYLAEHYRYYLL